MIDARRTVLPDLPHVAKAMRPEDRAEIVAASGESPRQALFRGYIASDECYTVYRVSDGLPLAVFGNKVIDPKLSAIVWLLASTDLLQHKWEFLRKSREWVERFQDKVPLLYNAVDQRNALHIRWLSWVGFSFIGTVRGRNNEPFIEFARLRCRD